MTYIHSCGYHCDKPGCIKAQRDDLVKKFIVNAREPLTEEEIDALMPEADGTAETNKVWNKNGDFPYLEYDEVDAWSKPLVILIARAIERAHGIGGEE